MFAEKSLIATIVFNPELFYLVDGIVTVDMFRDYKDIAVAVWSLNDKEKKVTPQTIETETRNKVKFTTHLQPLGSAINVKELELNAKAVSDRFYGTEFIGQATSAMMDLENGADPLETITAFTSAVLDISQGLEPDSEDDLETQILEVQKAYEKAREFDGALTGIPTGLKKLDEMTGGWQEGGNTVIAGRPGMGKTALMLDFILHAIQNGYPSAIFSWEMTSRELLQRLASKMIGVPTKKMNNAKLSTQEEAEFLNALSLLATYPLYIIDNPRDLANVRRKYIILCKTKGVKLFGFDFIQRIEFTGDTRKEITKISRGLANLSKTTKAHNLELSQLSRSVETRGGDKRPMLSDLKESGAIEEDAKLVLFPYRPEYYEIMEDEQGNSLKGKAEIIIPKNREGETGTIKDLDWIGETGQFKHSEDSDFFMPDAPKESNMRDSRKNDDLDDIPF